MDEEILAAHLAFDPEPAKADERRVEVLDRGTLDRDITPRDGSQADERPGFDVVGSHAEAGSVEFVHPFDGQAVGPDSGDSSAHGVEQMTEVLHVGFRRRVSDRREPLRPYRRHHGILRTGYGRFIEEEVGAGQAIGLDGISPVERYRRPKCLEGEEVGIHPTAPDHVSTGRREFYVSEARKQGTRQKQGGPDASSELDVDRIGAYPPGVDRDFVRRTPADVRPERLHDLKEGLDVANPRDVFERDGLGR